MFITYLSNYLFCEHFVVGRIILQSRIRGHISQQLFHLNLQAARKKAYMLFNLTPDPSVTGGTWYSDQEFESEFVEVLNQQCFKFLQQKVSSVLYSHSLYIFSLFCSTNLSDSYFILNLTSHMNS